MKKCLGKLNKLLSGKAKGDSSYLATMVCVFFIIVLVFACIGTFGNALRMNDVQRVHRRYLIRMERDGCLTPANEAQMITELTDLGCINIDLTGTSKSPVGYANPVRLVISCDVPFESINFSTSTKQGGFEHVTMDKSSTALYD